jgi:hypothetical protein
MLRLALPAQCGSVLNVQVKIELLEMARTMHV